MKSGHPIPTINSVYLSGRALGFDGKYYIVTHTRGGGGLHIFIYDPGTNSVELVGKWPTAAKVANYPGRLGGYCHRAIPVPAGKEHTFFAQEWTNPRPEVAITSFTLRLGDDAAEHGQVIVAAVSALVL